MFNMFKENDIITGLPYNGYKITNQNMTVGIVLKTYENLTMNILILNHYYEESVFSIFNVGNDSGKFGKNETIPIKMKIKYIKIADKIKKIKFDLQEENNVCIFNKNIIDEHYKIISDNLEYKEKKSIIKTGTPDVIKILNERVLGCYVFYQ